MRICRLVELGTSREGHECTLERIWICRGTPSLIAPLSSPSTPADFPFRRSCKIASTSLLGHGAVIGANTFITHSVLGRNVQTGSNTRIDNSYIFDGAIIGEGCTIKDSIIGEGVFVHAGSVIEGGALVAAGAVLGKGTRLDGNRVSLEEYEGEVNVGNHSRSSAFLSFTLLH